MSDLISKEYFILNGYLNDNVFDVICIRIYLDI